MGKRGVAKKSVISSSGKPLSPGEKSQMKTFGSTEGRKASSRQEIQTDISGEGGRESKRYHLQVPDEGSEHPLNNTFGPAFQPIVAPGYAPSRSGHFVLGQAAADGHRIAFEMARKTRERERIAGELMLPGEGPREVRKAVRMEDHETRGEDLIKSAPEGRGWGTNIDVVPNPRNKRNNSSGTDRLRA